MISRAYQSDIKGWDSDHQAISIDLTRSSFKGSIVSSFQQLKRFRCSYSEIKEITFSNLPNLECLDLSSCRSLTSLRILGCPNLRTLELASCRKLQNIEAELPNVEYFSAYETIIEKLPELPNVKYLNLLSTKISFDPASMPLLEEIHFSGNKSLSELTVCKNLVRINTSFSCITNDGICEGSSLKFITTYETEIKDGFPKDVYIVMGDRVIGSFPEDFKPTTWEDAAKLLYGPWGVPAVDSKPVTFSPNSVPCPDSIKSKEAASDAIAGAIFGSAIFDMIGLGTEFDSTPFARVATRGPFSVCWSHPEVYSRTLKFLKGTATDDTSQAVLIMRALIHSQIVKREPDGKTAFKTGDTFIELSEFCRQFVEWSKKGHVEHRDGSGLGMGRTVRLVLKQREFGKDPIAAAYRVWRDNGKNMAANGSVMRTAPTGCFAFWDLPTVMEIARVFGSVTHFDPRCVFVTVCISLICAKIIQKRAMLEEVDDEFVESIINQSIEESFAFAEGSEAFREQIYFYSNCCKIEELALGDPKSIGYSLKAFGCAIWALRYTKSPLEALIPICREGGDADTNGAVAGILVGARYGFKALPKDCLDLMFSKEWISQLLTAFLGTMGLPKWE